MNDERIVTDVDYALHVAESDSGPVTLDEARAMGDTLAGEIRRLREQQVPPDHALALLVLILLAIGFVAGLWFMRWWLT